MSKQISNEAEFKERLKQLGDLYEEGKDCLHSMFGAVNMSPFPDDKDKHARLYDILREMRDIAAVQMQKIHWVPEN